MQHLGPTLCNPPRGDLPQLITQLEAVLTQLKAAMGGGEEEGGDPDEGGGDPAEASSEESDPSSNDEGSMEKSEETGDAVEGLAENTTSQVLNVDEAAPDNGGMASAGPAAGKHTGADAALRAVYADTAKKTRLYDRLSKVVGAFDGAVDIASATAADIAAYGVKKLKLNAPKGQEAIALDAYLSGVEAARRSAPAAAAKRAADAAAPVPVIEAYFKE